MCTLARRRAATLAGRATRFIDPTRLLHTPNPKTKEIAILVGVSTPQQNQQDLADSLAELEQLADTAGAVAVDRLTQNLSQIQPATYLGTGKVTELKRLVEEREADLVIFDDDLSPAQARNLEKELGVKLLDRSGLILDIFATRAKTATAKTQVELAQLEYLLPRLTRMWTHLSRQKGGIGTKGPGETQIETDRRLIGQRISWLKDRLGKIDQQRTTQRKGRQQYTRVSLVGYTNAGKSTLMNALAETSVLAENRLFATLDSTTRLVQVAPNKEILLSDTVGFIRKLPHRLVESFKSTLDEVRESDVLLHVVDATHPRYEDHIEVVQKTLLEIGAPDKKTLMVFNKVDALEERGLLDALREAYPGAVFTSALRGIGLDRLKERLVEVAEEDYVDRVVYLPVGEGKTVHHVRSVADVISEDYVYAHAGQEEDPDASPIAVVRLHVRMAPRYAEDLKPTFRRYASIKPIAEAV